MDELVTFNDKKVRLMNFTNFRSYTGEMDKLDRIALISPHIAKKFVHSFVTIPDMDKPQTIECLDVEERFDPEDPCYCCMKFGMPDQKFGTFIFRYDTNKSGKILSADPNELSGQIMVWKFTENKFTKLQMLNEEVPLLTSSFEDGQRDIMVTCEGRKYQKLLFQAAQDAHWKKRQDWYDDLRGRVGLLERKIGRILGQSLSEEDLKDAFGEGGKRQSKPDDVDVNIKGLLDG